MMDALVNAGLLVFVFGGGYFVAALLWFTIQEYIARVNHRRHLERIARTLELRHYHRHL
jgi:hypothetical protein